MTLPCEKSVPMLCVEVKTPITCIIPFFTDGYIESFCTIMAVVPILIAPEHTMSVFRDCFPVERKLFNPFAWIGFILPYTDGIHHVLYSVHMAIAEHIGDPNIGRLLDMHDKMTISASHKGCDKSLDLPFSVSAMRTILRDPIGNLRMKIHKNHARLSSHQPFSSPIHL